MKFIDRIKSLGFQNYHEYLRCDHWIAFRNAYFQSHDKTCWHCHSNYKTCLHHITYDRIGAETDNDVIPLCRHCHIRVHDLIKERKAWLNEAHLYLSNPHRKSKNTNSPIPTNRIKKSKKLSKKSKKLARIQKKEQKNKDKQLRNKIAGGKLCNCLFPTYELRWNIAKNGTYQLAMDCSNCKKFFKWLNQNSHLAKNAPPK